MYYSGKKNAPSKGGKRSSEEEAAYSRVKYSQNLKGFLITKTSALCRTT